MEGVDPPKEAGWVEEVVKAAGAAADRAEVKVQAAWEDPRLRDRVASASARAADTRWPIKLGSPAIRSSAPSAAQR